MLTQLIPRRRSSASLKFRYSCADDRHHHRRDAAHGDRVTDHLSVFLAFERAIVCHHGGADGRACGRDRRYGPNITAWAVFRWYAKPTPFEFAFENYTALGYGERRSRWGRSG